MDHGRGCCSAGQLIPTSPASKRFPLLIVVALLALFPQRAAGQIYESIGIRAQGMGGAFTAVSDDATTTWWNPAGLASGGFFNAVLEIDRAEDSSRTRARAFALTVPSLGLSYYRLSLSGMRPPDSTGSGAASREDEGALNQFGATVGQSIGPRLIVASTVKLVHAIGDTEGDLDVGAMAALGPVRLGVVVKNLRTPEFSDGEERIPLGRQARAGVSFRAGAAGSPAELVLAADADLTRTATSRGDTRRVAIGAEAKLWRGVAAVRGGVGMDTLGTAADGSEGWTRSSSVGLSLALRSGFFVDGQLTRGSDEPRNGWGVAARVTF